MTVQVCEFQVMGKPIGKGRPRFTRSGRTYTPAETANYEKMIGQRAWVAMQGAGLKPTDRRVSVIITAFMPIPASYSRKKVSECHSGILIPPRPDIDNIAKAVLDACNRIVWEDDGQVWHLSCFKRYVDVGMEPQLQAKIAWDDPSK